MTILGSWWLSIKLPRTHYPTPQAHNNVELKQSTSISMQMSGDAALVALHPQMVPPAGSKEVPLPIRGHFCFASGAKGDYPLLSTAVEYAAWVAVVLSLLNWKNTSAR